MMLGGELTLRETVHQVEALRRLDDSAMHVRGRLELLACYRTFRGNDALSAANIDRMVARNTPGRIVALHQGRRCPAIWGFRFSLETLALHPAMASNGFVGYEMRCIVKNFVGDVHSVHGLRREIAKRRGKVHPDYVLDIPKNDIHANLVASLLHKTYVALDSVVEKPAYQRAIFPRGDRWVGSYTRQAALRDAKRIVPILAYTIFLLVVRILQQRAEHLTPRACAFGARYGFFLPDEGMANPQALALPAA